MTEFHDAATGAVVKIDPKQVTFYGPNWTAPGTIGTVVRLADGTRLTIRERFGEFHRWLHPAKPDKS
jgi:hypothetical protein